MPAAAGGSHEPAWVTPAGRAGLGLQRHPPACAPAAPAHVGPALARAAPV